MDESLMNESCVAMAPEQGGGRWARVRFLFFFRAEQSQLSFVQNTSCIEPCVQWGWVGD